VIYIKSLIISKNKPVIKEGSHEKDIPAEQYKTKKNPWFYGAYEHEKWPQRSEKEEAEGEEEINCLSPDF
jgi:hypothetical protein